MIRKILLTTALVIPTVCAALPTEQAVAGDAFYVATNGSDNNPGTLDAPFASLGKAQTAMRASNGTISITYIRAGSYTLPFLRNCAGGNTTCGLDLNELDNGETWSYYPPDGVDSASFNARSTTSGNGIFVAMEVDNTQNVTINGLSIHNFRYAAIASGGGTVGLTIENNLLFDGFYIPGSASSPGAFTCYGCQNTTISHNVVHDIAAFGVNNTNVNGDISGFLVTGNVLYNTCTQVADCGSIYAQDLQAVATNIKITNNYIRDGNTNAPLGTGLGSAIYADDCLSNVIATANVLTGRNGSNTVLTHGGNNVRFIANLTDLSTYMQSIAAYQVSDGQGCSAGTMSGNQYSNSIIIGAGGGGGYALLSGTPQDVPVITGNAYWPDGGSPIASAADFADTKPVTENPLVLCWDDYIVSGSPVYKAPVNFRPLVGGWGPPGYRIPETGSPPPNPGSCSPSNAAAHIN